MMLKGTLKRILAAAAVSAMAVGTVSAAAVSESISVSAPDRDYRDYPMTVAVNAPPDAQGAVLNNTQTQRPTTAQIWKDGSQSMLTWILPELKRGASVTYKITWSPRASTEDGGVVIRKGEEAAEVAIGGAPFTRYITSGAPKPYCYPVYGPTGAMVTRNYPMKKGVAGERDDHPHHRSLWFTHGGVNGTDYWLEREGRGGKEIHREFEAIDSGPAMGRLVARTDWVKPDGTKDCQDLRDIRFYNVANGRMFDWTLTILATEGPVTFTDTKEGTFGFRVAGSMKTDADKGGKIVNANGETDKGAWGKAAAWCDYSGPVDGEMVGIAVMDHPKSFRHPTHWHVRTYGLFAANPFGLHHFKNLRDERPGRYTVPEGESITFRYRVWIHKGATEEAGVGDVYDQYANPPKVVVK